ncbi:MAG TPA: hypothetical protein VKV20_11855 [Ktedonobacteraceae bacterium]|jgi:hypothetical protein|nr:hypothetical protein [Ktedonobacteraceae bacterium]
MDIIVAYFHPLLHTGIVKQDFEQIRSAGASSILYTIHEQEEQRLQRDMERGLRQAQDAGLKVHVSPGRHGNLFAGPSFVPSWYTFRHPQSRVMDRHGRYHDITCFNHQSFRSWLFKEIEHYLTSYPVNGILIDEPRGLEVTCFCSVCRALCPDVTDIQRFRRRSMIEFLGELCSCVKRVDSNIKTTIVLLPQDTSQIEDIATISDLDTIGCHLFWNLLNEDVTSVGQWSQELVTIARRQGKRSQLWLQNFNLDEESQKELDTAFTQILSADPDELGCYYFWRNNANPLSVWQETKKNLQRIPRRQLYWQVK